MQKWLGYLSKERRMVRRKGVEAVLMAVLWTGMVLMSVLWGAAAGRMEQVSAAALEGAEAAVRLCLSMAGPLCLWSGVMEVMKQSGLGEGLSRLLRPVLLRLYPRLREDRDTLTALSANVSANLLGLGSAATPMGIQAAEGMAKRSAPGQASDEMCLLIVCNSASIQLLPTTVAAVRGAEGCARPFDILPAVWLASGLALAAGIAACKILARLWRD